MRTLDLSVQLQGGFLRMLCGGTPSLDEMLAIIVDEVSRELQASACSIYLVDADGLRATQRAGSGYQAGFVGVGWCHVVPPDEITLNPEEHEKLGLTGWIISTGRSFLARNHQELASHPHRSGGHDPEQLPGEELRLQTFLGVPLRGMHGDVEGLIKAERRSILGTTTMPFSVSDQFVLEVAARVASKCLVYARMAGEGQADAAIAAWTRDVLEEAAATEGALDNFLSLAVDVFASAMDSDSCAIYLIDESKNTLTQRAGNGSLAPRQVIRAYPLPTQEQIEDSSEKVGLTAWIAATGQEVYARDFKELSSHPHHKGQYDQLNFPKETKTECGAFLGAPLKVGGTVIGVLKVENKSTIGVVDPRAFAEEARMRFSLLAQDLALIIARLQEQTPSRYQVIYEAQPTIFEILRGGLDVQELVEKVVSETAELFNARACALFLKEGNRLIQPRWAAYGWATRGDPVRHYQLVDRSQIKAQPAVTEEKVGLTVWIAVMEEKFTARSNLELTLHPHHRGKYDSDNFERGQVCESFMGVPLIVGGQMIGVLKVETKMKQLDPGQPDEVEYTYFDEQDELVFDFIANSAAIAIENARLLESQRLTEQIRQQPQGLLVAIHDHAKDHWQSAGTLKQVASHLGNRPHIVSIIETYAVLLQTSFNGAQLQAMSELTAQYGDFLDGGRAMSQLYGALAKAHNVATLPELLDLSRSQGVQALPSLDAPEFIRQVGNALFRLHRIVAECWSNGAQRYEGNAPADLACVQLADMRDEVGQLAEPEGTILRRVLDHWSSIIESDRPQFTKVVNPYVAGRPVDPAAGTPFFGRRDVFEWVATNLHGATQHNVLVLHGERRMGKTSILLQLARGARGRDLRERPDMPLCPVLIDLQGVEPSSTGHFLHTLARAVSREVSRHPRVGRQVTEPSLADFGRQPYTTFDGFMAKLDDLPVLTVLMLDEFELLEIYVNGGIIGSGIYGQLRHQMQFRSKVAFVLAGTHRLDDLSMEYKGVVYTVALHKEVSFMDDEAARTLVTEPVRGLVTYERAAVEELLRVTNGHPYLLQILCQATIQGMNARRESNAVSLSDILDAIDGFARQAESHLLYLWDQSSPGERLVLAALADERGEDAPEPTARRIAQRLSVPAQQVSAVGDRLLRRRLLRAASPSDDGRQDPPLLPAMPLLSRWIAYHHPLRSLLAIGGNDAEAG